MENLEIISLYCYNCPPVQNFRTFIYLSKHMYALISFLDYYSIAHCEEVSRIYLDL
jgi:hypothetical protein